MANWKLNLELTGYFNPTKEIIYFVDYKEAKKKKVLSEILCRTDASWIEKTFNNANIELKLEDKEFYLKSSDFPVSTSGWYKTPQLTVNKTLYEILEQTPVSLGVIQGSWSIVVDSASPIEYSIAEKSSQVYKDAEREMNRQFVFEVSKKTKKWTPGHRYEMAGSTVYFLGTTDSYRSSVDKPEYKTTSQRTLYMIAANVDESKYKTISEVLKDYQFFKESTKQGDIFLEGYIYLLESPRLSVENGEALKNDSPDIDFCLDESLKIHSGYDYVRSLSLVNPTKISQEAKDNIKRFLKKEMDDFITEFWDITYFSTGNLLTKNTEDQNIDYLIMNCLRKFNEDSLKGVQYYIDLFQAFGINPTEISKEVIKDFSVKEVLLKLPKTVKEIINNKLYFKRHSGAPTYIYGDLETKVKSSVTKKFLNSLNKTILDVNGTCFCKNFSRYNIGTKAKPKIVFSYRLDLEEIDNYYKGTIPEDLEKAILDEGIKSFQIECELGKDLL